MMDLSRLGKRRKEFGEAEGPSGPNERERASPSRWDSQIRAPYLATTASANGASPSAICAFEGVIELAGFRWRSMLGRVEQYEAKL